MEQNKWQSTPQESRGWEIVKQINEGLTALGNNTAAANASLTFRKLLAEYFGLGTGRPSRLHSAILSCAVKMATLFPDFHFVPFLEMWGIENLRTEDSEAKVTDDGKRFPSLVERLTKAYLYSLLFHPEEQLEPEMEQTMVKTMRLKGYLLREREGRIFPAVPAIATRVLQSEVRNRKMTFVSLFTPMGEEVMTEVHTLTQHRRMRYEEIPNSTFNLLLRTSEKGNIRVEAAYPCSSEEQKDFPICVGYIDYIDAGHQHIHVFDNGSRHFVEKYSGTPSVKEGDYVIFLPIIKNGNSFKSALITNVLENGADRFGWRNAIVTYSNAEQGYCAWELLPDADGKVNPIVETDASEQHEPGTKGYINKMLCDKLGTPLPNKGERLQIVTFLKRGKDRAKRPVVVNFRLSEQN